MNAEQKQRALQILRRFEQANPRTRQADSAAVDMAALLRELIEAPEQAAGVPVCRVSGYFGGYLTVETIDKAAVLPNGMALYAAPQAPAVSRDDIIKWAREAGGVVDVLAMGRHDGVLFTPLELERFAALVAAAERRDTPPK